jgi:tetratricopeptide (TPR) repeat protein
MTLDPDPDALALFTRANTQSGRDAVESLVACLQRAPEFGPAYVNLANLLRSFGLLDQARAMAEAAVALLPGDQAPLLCQAAILHDSADFAGAAALYEALLRTGPNQAGVLSSLGSSLQAMGRLAEALPCHARAVALAPQDADAHYNYADALLAAGDFTAGWAEYEWRWQRAHAPQRGLGPPWRGEDLAGRTILLHAEQGFGDTLQFARYAPLVAARGGRVVLEVQPALVRLMRSLPGPASVIAQGDALPRFDTHCPLLSLPRAFGTQLDSTPAAIPYLTPDPALASRWAARAPGDGRLRVGLAWAGSAHPHAAGLSVFDRRRSVPLATLAPLTGVPGVQWISLQTGDPAAELRDAPGGMIVQDPGPFEDFADTAALVAGLDLVIAVDTAVAHLAGALGRPVWLLSRADACWRWLDGRDDSPWYPTLRLYRQTQPLAWAPVTARVGQDLTAAAAQHQSR